MKIEHIDKFNVTRIIDRIDFYKNLCIIIVFLGLLPQIFNITISICKGY